jgi:hypothetical protein
VTVAPVGIGAVTFDKLQVPNLGKLTAFSPGTLGVTRRQTVTVDAGPAMPGQLPSTFGVLCTYTYLYGTGSVPLQASQRVTLVPLQAFTRRPPRHQR